MSPSEPTGRSTPGTDERGAVAAVIVGSLAAPDDPGLDELLGDDGARAVRAELAARARRWAAEIAPGRAFEATTLDAARAALHGHDGPVLLAAPDVPALDQRLARAALDDLAAGCDIALGAAHDARPYILAVRVSTSSCWPWSSAPFDGGVLGAFAERGITLGMLRHERRLASPGDAPALAIDPSAPPDLAALVRGQLPEPPRGSLGVGEDEREQEEAAADEAAHIGGGRDDELDYIERDSRPAGISDEAWRPVEEAGGGEAEGFEEAEAELIERAENAHGPSRSPTPASTTRRPGRWTRSTARPTRNTPPRTSRARATAEPAGTLRLRLGSRPTAGLGTLAPAIPVRIRLPSGGRYQAP